MTLASLINRPATIVRRSPSGSVDAYGNDVATEALVSTQVELQQIQRDEPAAAGETSKTLWLAIFEAGTELHTDDAILVDGQEYELEGDPWAARNPRTQAASHVEATLVRVAGAEDVS